MSTKDDIYAKAGIGQKVGFGKRPALLVVDFQKGFTSDKALSGSDMTDQVLATAKLVEAVRKKNIKVFYSRVGYSYDWRELGAWGGKNHNLRSYTRDDNWYYEIDDRLDVRREDILFEKHMASCFMGTPLLHMLIPMQIDTIIVTGCTTAGCAYATTVDSISYGYRTIVAEDCVTDRSKETHDMYMWNMGKKYADVMPSDAIIAEVEKLRPLEYAFMNSEC